MNNEENLSRGEENRKFLTKFFYGLISIASALAFFLLLYWTLLIAGKVLAQKGLVPPFLGLQFSNLIIGGTGVLLIRKISRA